MRKFWVRWSRARRDLVAMTVAVVVVFTVLVRVDGLESFITWSRGYERFEVDAVLTLLALMPVALAVYSARRLQDVRREARARREAQRDLAHQALHDALTGLPNRRLLNDRVQQAVRSARRSGTSVAIMVIDLDRFKEINDTLGHAVGDQLLVDLSRRLVAALRTQDTVARLGGDEYAVLLPDVADEAAALQAATRIQRALQRPFATSGQQIEVLAEASIGIAVYPIHGDDRDTLFRRADLAMYRAKNLQQGIALYEPAFDSNEPQRLALLAELHGALERQELILEYQPKTELATGRVTGVEALVRWQHPTRGLLLPAEFLPAAERTGLITPITRYVLDRALRQLRVWHDEGLELRVAVNLSARDLLDLNLPGEVERLLTEHRLAADSVELELTESTAMADPGRAGLVLQALRDLGVAVAIDDYGTGYTSLAYLRRLPVTQLKIDRSFVTAMRQLDENAAIVRSMIQLARQLGLEVVAEGVEDRETLVELAALGCDSAQGYYVSRPVAPDRLPDVVHHYERSRNRSAEPGPGA